MHGYLLISHVVFLIKLVVSFLHGNYDLAYDLYESYMNDYQYSLIVHIYNFIVFSAKYY